MKSVEVKTSLTLIFLQFQPIISHLELVFILMPLNNVLELQQLHVSLILNLMELLDLN